MKLSVIFMCCLICVSATAQFTNKDFKALHKVEGTWGLETKKGMLYETWVKTNDSILTSVSYRLNGTDTIVLERVRLKFQSGKIMYVPVVEDQNNRQPVVFTLTSIQDGRYTFENPEHDFPQRIIYNLPLNNQMHAWIEGNSKGKFAKSEYKFTRVK